LRSFWLYLRWYFCMVLILRLLLLFWLLFFILLLMLIYLWQNLGFFSFIFFCIFFILLFFRTLPLKVDYNSSTWWLICCWFTCKKTYKLIFMTLIKFSINLYRLLLLNPIHNNIIISLKLFDRICICIKVVNTSFISWNPFFNSCLKITSKYIFVFGRTYNKIK
jgi:hypothetical protein